MSFARSDAPVIVGRYRQRHVAVEAVQFTGEPSAELETWLGDWFESWIPSCQQLVISTPDWKSSEFTVGPGDWIIRGAAGEFCATTDLIFWMDYEPAEVTS